jgi:hypothetical protein
VICGFGPHSYILALHALKTHHRHKNEDRATLMAEKENRYRPGTDPRSRANSRILNETDLTEIEVEQDDLRIRVSRAGTHAICSGADRSAGLCCLYAAAAAAAPPPSAASPRRNPGQHDQPRRWSAPSTMAPAPGAPSLHRSRRDGQGRPDAAHHRSDEDDEPDPLAEAPARSSKSWSRTDSPSNTAKPLVVIE